MPLVSCFCNHIITCLICVTLTVPLCSTQLKKKKKSAKSSGSQAAKGETWWEDEVGAGCYWRMGVIFWMSWWSVLPRRDWLKCQVSSGLTPTPSLRAIACSLCVCVCVHVCLCVWVSAFNTWLFCSSWYLFYEVNDCGKTFSPGILWTGFVCLQIIEEKAPQCSYIMWLHTSLLELFNCAHLIELMSETMNR